MAERTAGILSPWCPPLEDVRAAYRQAVRYVDEQINWLLVSLEQLVEESTAVIITADHGEEFYEHKRWSYYQLTTRMYNPAHPQVTRDKSGNDHPPPGQPA
jgi:membrane-anchored protein YejM (alkaline phosphatase superfamily)